MQRDLSLFSTTYHQHWIEVTQSRKDHEKRADVCLWCFTTPTEYCTITYLFNIRRSTVCDVVHETCRAIVKLLMIKYGNDLGHVVDAFKTKWGYCNALLDVKSSFVLQAKNILTYNRKGWYSMIVQGLVDATLSLFGCLHRLAWKCP